MRDSAETLFVHVLSSGVSFGLSQMSSLSTLWKLSLHLLHVVLDVCAVAGPKVLERPVP